MDNVSGKADDSVTGAQEVEADDLIHVSTIVSSLRGLWEGLWGQRLTLGTGLSFSTPLPRFCLPGARHTLPRFSFACISQ